MLHKNPANRYSAALTFGRVHVVYPEVSDERTTAALVVEIDPVGLVRGKNEASGTLAQYVNDRPYVASSFLSVAIAEAFSTALAGRSKDRPELAETPIPLEIGIPVLPCRAPADRIERLFVPLGYEVEATRLALDENFPDWGDSPYYGVTLRGTVRLRDALRHLYLLLPVLDAKKHYYMDTQEVQKLVSKGEGWLPQHPERDWILRTSLGRKPSLMHEAVAQLSNAEEALVAEAEVVEEVIAGPDDTDEPQPHAMEPKKPNLHAQRHDRIVEIVRELRPKSVLDLGCGDGKLMRKLIPVQGLDRIVGMDVSYFDLEKAFRKLRLEDATPRYRERISLLHGSLTYRDDRLVGFDACTIIEVIEHLDLHRLAAFERVVFEFAQPKTILLTTPNREYNAVYGVEEMRHSDHRFEWTRAEFQEWATAVAARYGYAVRFEGIGDEDAALGQPSQLGVFTR